MARVERARVRAIEQDAPGVRFVKAEEQRDDGRFARAARADERDLLAGLGVEGKAAQHRQIGARGIAKETLSKVTAPRSRQREMRCARLRRRSARRRHPSRFALLAEKFPHALIRAERALELAEDLRKGRDRAADKERVERERRELPVRELPGLHERRAVPHDERDRAENAEDDEGDEPGAPPHAAQRRVEIARRARRRSGGLRKVRW